MIPTLILRYSYSKYSKPIDAEKYCDTVHGIYWTHFGNLPKFIRRYEEVIYGRSSSDYEHCIRNHRQNVAIVNIQIATSANDLINKIVKTPRVTTADILSNIGKYIYNHNNNFLILLNISNVHYQILGGAMGLFMGFSILSFFEIIYWLYRLIGVNL